MRHPVLFLLVIFAFGCGGDDHLPKGLLDRADFKESLLQAQLIEAKASREMAIDHDPAVGRPRAAYHAMFEKQGISEAQFDSTFAYYQARPLELKELYEEVLTDLGKRKDALPQ